ncbi:hypothetical protein SAY87_001215 [Trapa incisa]|uniref:Uncharacterized protein n=1 Tax=Trapa incisa TaxID=236973 RepID=A0AAN7JGS9_9MYRT|nr:hypothetical protein SAY87_001215 [Trapa incisa]
MDLNWVCGAIFGSTTPAQRKRPGEEMAHRGSKGTWEQEVKCFLQIHTHAHKFSNGIYMNMIELVGIEHHPHKHIPLQANSMAFTPTGGNFMSHHHHEDYQYYHLDHQGFASIPLTSSLRNIPWPPFAGTHTPFCT